jgi:IS5 family transposase
MKQLGLNTPVFVKKPKLTKRQKFLQEMERVVPWALWVAKIAPHYPVAGRGRRPFPLETMLRIHLLQQWFGYSDPAMEEALHDVPMLREFAGLDAGEDAMPDETTILKFRRLLETHALAQALFDGTAARLAEQGLLLRQGTAVDATLIAAPPSTKNRDHKRDPEMTSTKKGSNYYFGLKAHIGVDADSGLVHTAEITTAKVADGIMTDVLLHGEETVVLGDRAYTRNDRNLEAEREEHDPVWASRSSARKARRNCPPSRRCSTACWPRCGPWSNTRSASSSASSAIPRCATAACPRTRSNSTCCSRSATFTTCGRR